jgi:hypothetical protein
MIIRSPFPNLRPIEALATSLSLLLLVVTGRMPACLAPAMLGVQNGSRRLPLVQRAGRFTEEG